MLVAFDFDGVLVEPDPYVLLGERHGVGADVAGLVERMANGDLTHEAGLRSTAQQLAGLPEDDVSAAYEHLQSRSEAERLVRDLQRADHHVAVVTDAPAAAVDAVTTPDGISFDSVVANRFPVENGALTGAIDGPLLGDGKARHLGRVAVSEGFDTHEAVAVGDDHRDLSMLQFAGLGLGLDPEPFVAARCDETVTDVGRLRELFAQRNAL